MSARLPVAKMFPENAPPDGGRMSRAWLDVLVDVPLLAGLSRRNLGKVAALGRTKRFPARTSIVTAGTNADAFYVILDGQARPCAPGSAASRSPTGDYFGEMALLDGGVRSASVVADTEMLVMAIPRRGFLKLLESEPKIAISIMGTLAHRVRSMQATSSSV